MSSALVTGMLVLAFAMMLVRRRSVAIVLLAVQSLALGMIAIDPSGRTGDALIGCFLIAARPSSCRCCCMC